MADSQTIVLGTKQAAEAAVRVIIAAPPGSVMKVNPPKRTNDQNALMWALLSDVSRSMPGGRRLTADVWKAVFMNACGHAVQFETGLSGEPFPIGFRSSRLSKQQMTDLIEFILAWGAENGVQFTREAA